MLSNVSSLTDIFDNVFRAFNNIGHKIFFSNVFALFGVHNVQLPLITACILFTAILLCFKLSFLQVREVVPGIKMILGLDKDTSASGKGESISSVKALFAVLAGAAGLGNIVGVSAAIAVGGPGAAFWMLFTPFLTMPLRFAEVFVGHKYRVRNKDGSFSGGPSYYMKAGLKEIGLPKIGLFLASVYAVLIVIGSFGGGSSFQSNQVVKLLTNTFDVLHNKELSVSLVFVIPVAIVLLGGISRIATFLAYMTPFTIGSYFFLAMIVILYHWHNIMPSICLIIKSAFDTKAALSGLVASFVIGFNRIVVATEVGLGSAPTMHSNSCNEDSVKEAILSTASPIVDTIFVCFTSVLVTIVSGTYNSGLAGIMMTAKAFESVSSILPILLVIIICFMGTNVVVAWGFYGARNFEYLCGKKWTKFYLMLYCIVVFSGGIISDFDVVIKFTDIVNTIVALPNLVALIMLSGITSRAYSKYRRER